MPSSSTHRLLGIDHCERSLDDQQQRIGQLFAETIEGLYRAAIRDNPSPVNQMAYARYLASHGMPLRAIHEFESLLEDPVVYNDSRLLAEVSHQISQMEKCFNSDFGDRDLASSEAPHPDADSRPFAVASEFAEVILQLMADIGDDPDNELSLVLMELNEHAMDEIGGLVGILHQYHQSCERRVQGRSLLKLAEFCAERQWSAVQVACLKKALRCFGRIASEVSPASERGDRSNGMIAGTRC
jgi:hypothetical protein